MKTYKCKKSLYKSTYKKNAISKNRIYKVVEEDTQFFWLEDNLFNSFNFAKKQGKTYYTIDDYFETKVKTK